MQIELGTKQDHIITKTKIHILERENQGQEDMAGHCGSTRQVGCIFFVSISLIHVKRCLVVLLGSSFPSRI